MKAKNLALTLTLLDIRRCRSILCAETLYGFQTMQKPKGAGEDEADVPSPLRSSAWGKNGQPVPRWNHLDNFHKRYNKVGKIKCRTILIR